MNKHLKLYDEETGEVIEDIRFTGGYNIQWAHHDDSGEIKNITTLNNAKWGKKHWIRNYMYTPIANKLIEKFKELSFANADEILFLEDIKWTPKNDKHNWKARAKKANNQLVEFSGYKFIIETRKYYIDQMSEEQIIVLLYHELRHIDSDGSIKKHDIEDWNNIITTLGAGWYIEEEEISDILSDNFKEWDMLLKTEKQLSIYDKRTKEGDRHGL